MSSVDLSLTRPQYVSVPEGFIVALASQEFRQAVDSPQDPPLALAYETNRAGTSTKTLRFEATRPSGERLTNFSRELENAGLYTDHGQDQLAEAVATAIAGVQVKAGRTRSSVPMTVNLSLLQNMRGLVGTKNPPDTAKILETFFAMGCPDERTQKRAGELWTQAANRRRSIDPLVSFIDTAVDESLLEAPAESRTVPPIREEGREDFFRRTPFSWFHRTWTRLCTNDWVDALPSRVWVDWASAVLRLAFGMGYLWEVAWYEEVSRSVLSSEPVDGSTLSSRISALVPWRDSTAAVSVRDIASVTRWRVMRSQEVRKAITSWIRENRDVVGVKEQIGAMAMDDSLCEQLKAAASGGDSDNENLWEAINYTLRTRGGSGESIDHYGLWRRHRSSRYSILDPGVEWMAAIASLTCSSPGGSTNVGRMMSELRELGLRPELGDLLSRLERAGVARGSADADQAVEIRAAF